MITKQPFFVFDVEAVGLYGEGFAVAGGIYINGAVQSEFCFCCPLEEAIGADSDREWVKAHVPVISVTHRTPDLIREAFWTEWQDAKKRYPNIKMAGECIWPVEAKFVMSCVRQGKDNDCTWDGPYPFHEISSIMLVAGMDPMASFERKPSEMPPHHPLTDSRLSARLLEEALNRIKTTAENG